MIREIHCEWFRLSSPKVFLKPLGKIGQTFPVPGNGPSLNSLSDRKRICTYWPRLDSYL